jgi:hypothetical protein
MVDYAVSEAGIKKSICKRKRYTFIVENKKSPS